MGRIGALEQMVRRIGKIVDGINTVSIQTNMLAISGSVEAARSGDAGRGFALVSADIRNLARDSAENGDRIKDTVQAIQDHVRAVRMELEVTLTANELEIRKNRDIITTFVAVEADMAAVRTGNQGTASGCRRHPAGGIPGVRRDGAGRDGGGAGEPRGRAGRDSIPAAGARGGGSGGVDRGNRFARRRTPEFGRVTRGRGKRMAPTAAAPAPNRTRSRT